MDREWRLRGPAQALQGDAHIEEDPVALIASGRMPGGSERSELRIASEPEQVRVGPASVAAALEVLQPAAIRSVWRSDLEWGASAAAQRAMASRMGAHEGAKEVGMWHSFRYRSWIFVCCSEELVRLR